MKKRFFSAILAFLCTIGAFSGTEESLVGLSLSADAASQYSLNLPTQEEIRARYQQFPFELKSSATYTTQYSLSAPYAMGDISDYDRQNALYAINFCRYIAGLPDDVKMTDEYNTYAQAASLVNAVNGSLSHTPAQPSGMNSDLYTSGYNGAGRANIARGYPNLAESVIMGYMEDSDDSNISRVGHRRWLLKPDLEYVGIGMVDKFSAVYHNFANQRSGTFTGDYVAWPPQNMPYEMYVSYSGEYAFSVTLGSEYDVPNLADITVEVTSQKLGKSWTLNQNSTSYSEYLTVENSYYGDPKCIIFNVGMFPENDCVFVKINGTAKSGAASPIEYTVNFFSLESSAHTHDYKLTSIKAASCTETGAKNYVCGECGDTITEIIPKTEHNYSSKWTIDKAATCAEEGSKSHHCTVCGGKSDVTVIEKTAHTYTTASTKAATCSEEGVMTSTCTVCGDVVTAVIPKIAHTFSTEWTIDKAATCVAEGSMSHHCTVCGEKTDITSVAKTYHAFQSEVTKEPTCTVAGILTNTCSECARTRTEAISALGHSFGDYVITQNPTADSDGSETRTCTRCGETQSRIIPKTGSSDSAASDNPSSKPLNSSSSDSTNSDGPDNSDSSDSENISGNLTNSDRESRSDSTASAPADSTSAPQHSADDSSSNSQSQNSSDITPQDSNFIKDNLLVILIAGCSAFAIAAAVIIGVVAKKKK